MPMPIQSPTESICDILLPFLRDQDARPTFVLRSIKGKAHLAFANKALHRLQTISPPGTDIIQICHTLLLSSNSSSSDVPPSSPSNDYILVATLTNRLTKAYHIPRDENGSPGWLCVMEDQPVPENVRNGEINLRDSEPEMNKPLVARSNKIDFPVGAVTFASDTGDRSPGSNKRTLRTPLLANVGNADVIDGTVKTTPVKLEYRESPPSPTKVIGVVSNLTGKDESLMDPRVMAWDSSRPLPVLDWTKGYDGLTEDDAAHFAFLRSIEWEKTGIGHMSSWPESLRTIANAIMPLPNPTVLYLTELGMSIYNEKWKGIAQERHPWLMGAPFVQGWPEAVVYFKPILRGVMEGKCVFEENSLFFLQRTLPQEEAYISFSMTPVIGSDGRFLAVLTMAFENTNNVVRKRRVKVIQTLSEKMAYVKDLDPGGGFWNGILDSLDENPHDSPFAIMYKVTDDGRSLEFMDGRGLPESEMDLAAVLDKHCDISAGPNGVAPNTSTAVFTKYLKRLNEDTMAFYQVDFTTDDMTRLSKMRYRGFNECESFVVMRIHTHDMVLQAVLVLGLNNRSPLTSPYRRWLANICHATSSTVSKARLLQEEVNRRLEDKIAALERAKATEVKAKLLKRTQELRESELLFTKTAASIPVGLVQLDRKGSITYANDAWHRLCGLEIGGDMDDWPRIIYSGDLPKVQSAFNHAIANKSTMAMELRMGNDSTLGSKGWSRWCSNTIDPNIDETTGEVTGYFGTLVDITSIKDAEEFQRQLTIDALERKRQQDNFIDVNPLSAILQSADEVIRILEEFSSQEVPEFPTAAIQDALEAADTILACGEHQKKIIDDILNVSKLDAGLLTVCPVPVMPHLVLERTMKIFNPELKSSGIASDFKLTNAYNEHCGPYWWAIDPARLTQILINLVTNAIKFTGQKSGRKEINVTVDASVKRPEIKDNFTTLTADDGLDFSTTATQHEQQSSGLATPDEDAVYLHVHVQDTGIGFSNELRKTLGQRFQQAPKTHVTYGGSGLGIFIARKLAYLLGGELHFDSEEGEGSTFSFFVRCPKCPPPEDGSTREASQSPAPGVLRNVAVPPRPGVPARRAAEDIPVGEAYKSHRRSVDSGTTTPSTTSTTGKAPTSKKRGVGYDILVVEDNKLNQTILRKQLDNIGCRTSVANNGLECLEILKEKPEFTVVLMDMEMPVMDGILATQRIRAIEEGGIQDGKRRLTIIGTSANARDAQIEEMMGAGMDAVITKPFLIGDLMTKIETVLEERKRSASALQNSTEAPITPP